MCVFQEWNVNIDICGVVVYHFNIYVYTHVCVVWNVNTDISCPPSSPAACWRLPQCSAPRPKCQNVSSPQVFTILHKLILAHLHNPPQNDSCNTRPILLHDSCSTVWSPIAHQPQCYIHITKNAQQFSSPSTRKHIAIHLHISQCLDTTLNWLNMNI